MEQAKVFIDKVLSNQFTAFLFVLSCAIGATLSIAGTYWLAYQAAILIGAY